MKSTVAPYETTAWCVRIECVGGLVIRLTTYPFNLTMSNATVYETDSGYEQTAYSGNVSMAPGAIDITGIVGAGGVTRDQIASGIMDDARVFIFKTSYLSPVEDYEPVVAGFFGKTTIEDDRYTVEGMSLLDALNQNVGKVYTPTCSRTFGDTGCGKSLAALTFTGAVVDQIGTTSFRDTSRTEAADYFGAGKIKFTSGANSGLPALDIKDFAAGGLITIYDRFYSPLVAGDTYQITAGCRRRLADCRDKWSNVVNFFGFPNMPTTSVYSQVAGNR